MYIFERKLPKLLENVIAKLVLIHYKYIYLLSATFVHAEKYVCMFVYLM